MRRVAGAEPGVVRNYIPESYGNRKDSEPVTVTIRQPTEREKRNILTRGEKMDVTQEGKDGEITVKIRALDSSAVNERDGAIIAEFIESVSNYETAGGNPIDDGARLAEHGEVNFIAEIAAEIILGASLTEAERKKSKE